MIKKILLSALVVLGLAAGVGVVQAAPTWVYQTSILPQTDNTFDLGSSTPAKIWKTLFVKTVCLSGDCKSAWPAASSGSGTVGTSSAETATQVPWWTTTAAGTALLSGGSSGFTFNSAAVRLTVTNASTTAFSSAYASSTALVGGSLQVNNLTGILKANGTSVVTVAANGTDFTLLSANTCGAGQFFNSATAAGVLGCGTPSAGSSGLSTTSPLANSNLLVYSTAGAGAAYGVATGTVSNGNGISVTAGQSVIGSGLTITNTGVLSNILPQGTFTGALTYGTTSNTTNGITSKLMISGSGTTLTFSSDQTGTLTVPGGGTGVGTFTASQLLYGNGTANLSSVGTTTFTPSAEFTVGGTIGAFVGGANSTLTLATGGVALTKLATQNANTVLVNQTGGSASPTALATSTFANGLYSGTAGQVLGRLSNGTWSGVATTTFTTGLTYAAGNVTVNTSQNIATLSNLTTDGVVYTSGSAGTLNTDSGALDYIRGGTGTTTAPVSQLLYGGASAYQSVATTSVSCSGTVSCTAFTAIGAAPITLTGSGASFSGSLGQVNYFSGANTAVGTSTITIDTTSRVGIGSTTPYALLGLGSSIAPVNPLFQIMSATSSLAASTASTTKYTTNFTYNPTAGTRYVLITMYGGGGGGATNGNTTAGGGGGSSQFGTMYAGGGGGGGTGGGAGGGGGYTQKGYGAASLSAVTVVVGKKGLLAGTGGAGAFAGSTGGSAKGAGAGGGSSAAGSAPGLNVGGAGGAAIGGGGGAGNAASATGGAGGTGTAGGAGGGTGNASAGQANAGGGNSANGSYGGGGGGGGGCAVGGDTNRCGGGGAGGGVNGNAGGGGGGYVMGNSFAAGNGNSNGGASNGGGNGGNSDGGSGTSQGGIGGSATDGKGGPGGPSGADGSDGSVTITEYSAVTTTTSSAQSPLFTISLISASSTVNSTTSAGVGIGTSTPMATLAIQSFDNLISFAVSTFINGVQYMVEYLDKYGHLITGGPTPVINNCPGGVITGDDRTGNITLTSGTSCSIVFANPWPVVPVCALSPGTNSTYSVQSATTIGATFVFGSNQTTFNYICQAHQ